MLNIVTDRSHRDCDGMARREFLKIGTLGAGAMTLSGLLAARAAAKAAGQPVKDTSIVWVWLAGGPTHVETFDPHMRAPVEYRSTTGEVRTKLPGVTIGGTFPRIAGVADKMALVRSFAHNNSGHVGGTHFVNTGYDNRTIDNGGVPARPSIGSIVARVRGSNHPQTGMPTYVALNRLRSGIDGPAFLGTAFAPVRSIGTGAQEPVAGGSGESARRSARACWPASTGSAARSTAPAPWTASTVSSNRRSTWCWAGRPRRLT